MTLMSDEIADSKEFEQILTEVESQNKAIKQLTSKYHSLEKERS